MTLHYLARAALLLLCAAAPARAQDTHVHNAPAGSWQWGVSGTAFGGYNYQRREFTDFDEVESQNWLTTSLGRSLGAASHLEFIAMLSLEPLTMRDLGSPQVFQTGETFGGRPLIDYQHPHDLVMNLGAELTHALGASMVSVGAYAVGPAPYGPPVFMHRPSAAENPQVPLSHHYLDASHITTGVVSVGLERAGFRVEAGAFHGREPDENRLDLDTAAPDSYGGRLSWADGPWSIQLSGADLKTPERASAYDAKRVTASVSFFKGDENRSIAWLAAFGQNREVHGNLEAYLIEATRRAGRNAFYTRAEHVAKDILDAGFHPLGVAHQHRQSPVNALTLGYVRDLSRRAWGTIGVGGDVTGYTVPANLAESYGSPLSFHIFARYRGRAGAPGAHVH
jgi:hypothetical protein